MAIGVGLAKSALVFARRGYFNDMDSSMEMGAIGLHVKKNIFN